MYFAISAPEEKRYIWYTQPVKKNAFNKVLLTSCRGPFWVCGYQLFAVCLPAGTIACRQESIKRAIQANDLKHLPAVCCWRFQRNSVNSNSSAPKTYLSATKTYRMCNSIASIAICANCMWIWLHAIELVGIHWWWFFLFTNILSAEVS